MNSIPPLGTILDIPTDNDEDDVVVGEPEEEIQENNTDDTIGDSKDGTN